jgi:hypothetical protein
VRIVFVNALVGLGHCCREGFADSVKHQLCCSGSEAAARGMFSPCKEVFQLAEFTVAIEPERTHYVQGQPTFYVGGPIRVVCIYHAELRCGADTSILNEGHAKAEQFCLCQA